MRLCQTIAVSSLKALRAERDAVRPGGRVSLVELRLDHLAAGELDVAGALEGRAVPVIVTCRPVRQGGKFEGSEEARLRVLRDAARLGAEFVDVEFDAALTLTGTRPVISHHDFAPGIPADLADRVRAMRARACANSANSGKNDAIVKIAITAERPRDCVTLRETLFGSGDATAGTIGIAMGEAGALSRMLPAKFSGEWMYAGSAAPGQFSVAEMAERFRVHEVTARTRTFAIAGKPLSHSASPAMHNAAFKRAGIDAVIVPVETADAAELRAVAESLGIEGLAVTAPLKASVMSFAEIDDRSRSIGAINTLKRVGSGWEGRNFDASAFSEPLKEYLRAPGGLRAIVLGAGGAARAAVTELLAAGCKVEISARDAEKAASLAAELGAGMTTFPPAGPAALIVNATSAGTKGSASPVPRGAVSAEIAYDLVYNPEHTAFLEDARTSGARTIGGLAMLVAQARRQFGWWTGVPVSTEVFEQAAREFIR